MTAVLAWAAAAGLVTFGLDRAPRDTDDGLASDGWLMRGSERLLPAAEMP